MSFLLAGSPWNLIHRPGMQRGWSLPTLLLLAACPFSLFFVLVMMFHSVVFSLFSWCYVYRFEIWKDFSHYFRSFPLHLGLGVQMCLCALSLGWVLESVLLLGRVSVLCLFLDRQTGCLSSRLPVFLPYSDTPHPMCTLLTTATVFSFHRISDDKIVYICYIQHALKHMYIANAVYI